MGLSLSGENVIMITADLYGHLFSLVLLCLVLSCYVMLCLVMLFLVMSCCVMSCYVLVDRMFLVRIKTFQM